MLQARLVGFLSYSPYTSSCFPHTVTIVICYSKLSLVTAVAAHDAGAFVRLLTSLFLAGMMFSQDNYNDNDK